MSTPIVISVDEVTRERLAKAAAEAGQTLVNYIIDAAQERSLREAARRYERPDPRQRDLVDAAVTRLASRAAAADARAAVLAKYISH